MKGLIYVVTGQAVDPYNDSFKKNTSEYKSCKYNGGTYIPFNEVSTINSFDNAVKTIQKKNGKCGIGNRGKTKIVVKEHFSEKGKTMEELLTDVMLEKAKQTIA